MALQALVKNMGYVYHTPVNKLDEQTKKESQQQFLSYKTRGVLQAESYDSTIWTLTDEVHQNVSVSFAINEIKFRNIRAKELGCSLADFHSAIRVLATSMFGYSIATIRSKISLVCKFANELSLPQRYEDAQWLLEFLELLPGDTLQRSSLVDSLEDIFPENTKNQKQRVLADYQSYFRFDTLLAQFWSTATSAERLVYFPLYYWWKVTAILPMRPTECVLTPRNCLSENNGKAFLTIRRTKLKGTKQSADYRIDKDYESCSFEVPRDLADVIRWYIDATKERYASDIDVLFCKSTQFDGLYPIIPNDHHYTYANLAQLLDAYYQRVIVGKYQYTICSSDVERIEENTISKIHLGDTRHIAMVSLMISGGSPTVCKALAGHADIEISAHYYTNIKSFLDVLSFERVRVSQNSSESVNDALSARSAIKIRDGYCRSPRFAMQDFADCAAAVNADGQFCSCEVCGYFLPQGSSFKLTQNAEEGLKHEIALLGHCFNALRQSKGNLEDLSCTLDRLRAQAEQYVHASVIERMLMEVGK